MKNAQYESFAALICATDIEEEKMAETFDWKPVCIPGDRQMYYETVIIRNDRKLRIFGARQPGMGMVESTCLSMKLIEHFRPLYLIMPGIMAGGDNRDGRTFFGDINLAESVWDYANGKYVSPECSDVRLGSIGFLARPTYLEMPPELVLFLNDIRDNDINEFTLHTGTVACGNCVVASREAFEKLISRQSDETIGMDMESYGVAFAAANCTEPRPYSIIAKSICDYADENKNNRFQEFAAFNSFQFVKHLLEDLLPPDLEQYGKETDRVNQLKQE